MSYHIANRTFLFTRSQLTKLSLIFLHCFLVYGMKSVILMSLYRGVRFYRICCLLNFQGLNCLFNMDDWRKTKLISRTLAQDTNNRGPRKKILWFLIFIQVISQAWKYIDIRRSRYHTHPILHNSYIVGQPLEIYQLWHPYGLSKHYYI